ncbi:MAG: MBL fold metallo-hydrolase, partial [Bacteroidota bacterium]
MKIADGIDMLEVSGSIMGPPGLIHPTLLWDHEGLILVDTGFPGQAASIRAAVKQAGHSFDELSRVILTHQDIDHIGGLKDIVRGSQGRVRVLAHEVEILYIDGRERPLKIARAEARWDALPDDYRRLVEVVRAAFERSTAPVDHALHDGEELPYAGGIRVILTPGHTLGHICLYHVPSRTLIAGDALSIREGALVPPPDSLNYDTSLGIKSLGKLTRLDIAAVICYHGGLFTDDPNQRIAALA